MTMNNHLSILLEKPYFLLEEFQSHACTHIHGMVQMNTINVQPPEWMNIQLLGTEIIGKKSRIIIDDVYRVSNQKSAWIADQGNDFQYTFPFDISIQCDSVPSSFQMISPNDPSDIIGGIFYSLEVITPGHRASHPIQLYRTYDVSAPRRVFWGIATKQKWQYELEFPQIFDTTSHKSGSISVRLRSTYHNNNTESCLIGCQLIQSFHLNGIENHYQLLMTQTHLLTKANASWKQPCQIEFELDDAVLPTVINSRIGVTHSLRITLAFCNLLDMSNHDMEFSFPVKISGGEDGTNYVYSNNLKEVSVSRSQSTSSHGTDVISFDSAIDIPNYKSS